MAWVILMSAFEKVSYPTVLCIMAILGYWEMLGLTILIESILSVMILFTVSKGQRLEMAVKAILVTPVRYLVIVFDAYTLLRFATDLWITRDRRWRK